MTVDDPVPPCGKCGQVHERAGVPTCSAHSHKGTQPCLNYPSKGSRVCWKHGGKAPQVKAAAQERHALEQTRRAVSYALRDVAPVHSARSPEEQLLDEVGRSAQAVDLLSRWVAELTIPDPDNPPGGEFEDIAGIGDDGEPVYSPAAWFRFYGPKDNGELGVHPLVKLLNEERDRHVKFCDVAIKAGISERLVRQVEGQAHQIVAVLTAVIEGLDLDQSQRHRARQLAAAQLRLIGSIETTARPA